MCDERRDTIGRGITLRGTALFGLGEHLLAIVTGFVTGSHVRIAKCRVIGGVACFFLSARRGLYGARQSNVTRLHYRCAFGTRRRAGVRLGHSGEFVGQLARQCRRMSCGLPFTRFHGAVNQARWIGERLGASTDEVNQALELLEQTGQIERNKRGFEVSQRHAINTSRDPDKARALKATWLRVALQRLEAGNPGNFGYSVFSISRADMKKMRDLHLEYLRAMQQLIAKSEPNECVGLYCAQLLDLATVDNALT